MEALLELLVEFACGLLLEFISAISGFSTAKTYRKAKPRITERRLARKQGSPVPPTDGWLIAFAFFLPITAVLLILLILKWGGKL